MNDDLRELLSLLNSHGVEYLVIGAHAVAFHGYERFTQDIDVWVNPTRDNAEHLKDALDEFGAPIGSAGAERFASATREMVRLGVPPSMVDILNFTGGPEFADVWRNKMSGELGGIPVAFPAKLDLVAIKKAAGREQDLLDIKKLEQS